MKAQKLSKAFTNFRQGRAGFPAAKRKAQTASVKFSCTSFSLAGRHHVRLSRVGLVKAFESMRKLARRLENGSARVVTATVRRRSAAEGSMLPVVNGDAGPCNWARHPPAIRFQARSGGPPGSGRGHGWATAPIMTSRVG